MPASSNFNPFYPQGYAQQLQIARNQQLADQLMQESQQGIQYDQRGPISPLQGLSKVGQALAAGMAYNREIDEANQYGQGAQANLDRMFPNQASPQAQGGNPSSQALAAGLSGGQPPSQGGGMPSATGNPQADRALYMLDPTEYAKALAARLAPTTEQKNVAGGGPLAFKTVNVPPVEVRAGGGTALDPRTLQPVFSTPDANGYRANQDGSMSPVPIAAPQVPTPAPQGASGGLSNGPQSEGPFGGNAPVLPGMDRIPAPGGTPNLQQAQASPPQAPESPTNLGTSVNSPAIPAPQTLPQAIAQQAASKAAGVTGAEDTAKNVAEAQKTFAVANSALPQVLQRFQDMHAVAKDASSGFGMDAEGNGFKVKANQALNSQTSEANAIMRQKPAQNIIAELGPQLAQGGMRGNKFLETLSSKASGINLDDSPSGKAAAINGLQTTYIGNLKAEAAAIRAQGGQAPSDADIDKQVAQINAGLHQEGQTATNPQTGAKAVYHYGQWKVQ